MEKNGFMENLIRSVPSGKKTTMELDGVNVASWRAKVAQINQADGYTHYSVAVSSPMNIFGIINNGDKDD